MFSRKRMIIWLVMLTFCVLCSEVSAKRAVVNNRVDTQATIAVMNLGTRPGAVPSVININGAGMTSSEYLISTLSNSGCFQIMENDLVIDKIAELGIKTDGVIDPDSARILGEALKSKYILYGNVTGVTVKNNSTNIVFAGVNVCAVKAYIIARLMDVQTGEILVACKGEGRSSSSYTQGALMPVTVYIGTSKVTQESVHNAVQKAAKAAVDDLLSQLGVSAKEIAKKNKMNKFKDEND